ncbi:hypothetical protein R69919_01214 [Paraburkholderia gardini]|jgi:hypothetical protein|uniref:Uncharacterized protein n=1 Tax=Paraburkholderia gardini TaxID=2823469 RepID=A0ABM8TYH9_9BURK|nr:hypothetical protein R54767_00532 [Paraburkholderia gardini]CAG4891593.1 hypothetical protein R69919_01214 [Paraburkholderia gardini]
MDKLKGKRWSTAGAKAITQIVPLMNRRVCGTRKRFESCQRDSPE